MVAKRTSPKKFGEKIFSLEVLVGKETLPFFYPDMKSLKIEDLLSKKILLNKKKSEIQTILKEKNYLYKRELSGFAYLLNDISRVVTQDKDYNLAVKEHDSEFMREKVISTIRQTSDKIISICYSGSKTFATKHKLNKLIKKFYSVHKKNSNESVLFEYGLLRTLFLQRNQKRKVSGEPTLVHPINSALNYFKLVDKYLKSRNFSGKAVENVRNHLLSTEIITSIIAHDSTEDYSSKVKKELGVKLIDFSDEKNNSRIDLKTKEIYLNWQDSKIFQNKLGLKILERFSELSTNKIISLLSEEDQEKLQNSFNIAHSTNNYLSTIYPSVNQVRKGFFRRQNFSLKKASFLGRLYAGLVKLVESDDNENTLDTPSVKCFQKYFLDTFYKRKLKGKSTMDRFFFHSEKSSSSETKMQRFLKDYLSRRIVLERTLTQLAKVNQTQTFNPTKVFKHTILDLSLYANFIYSQNALTNTINSFKQEMILNENIPKSFLKNLLSVMGESKQKGLYDQINSLGKSHNYFELSEAPFEENIDLNSFMKINRSLSEVLGYMNDTKIPLNKFALFKNLEGSYEQELPGSKKLKALSTIFYFGLFGGLEKNIELARSSLLSLGYSKLPAVKTTKTQLYID